MSRTNVEDKILRTKCWEQNVEDKMLRTKCCGQNVEDKTKMTSISECSLTVFSTDQFNFSNVLYGWMDGRTDGETFKPIELSWDS